MAKCENCIHEEVCCPCVEHEVCEQFKDKTLVVELPCKVGDKVYYLNTNPHIRLYLNEIYEATVVRVVITEKFVSVVIQIHDEIGCTEIPDIRDFGKTVFFNREEAERELEKQT